jgi:uncharacterized protein
MGPDGRSDAARHQTHYGHDSKERRYRAVIVHGYESSPGANWFPWLKNALEAEDMAVTVVPLPDPDDPDKAAWENAVSAALGVPDATTTRSLHIVQAIN